MLSALKLRRIIGLALLALAGLVVSGCSMVRLTYDQAPNLLYWWIDGYVDVGGEQTPKLREGIDLWFAWHRRTQLPEYAALLVRAQREVGEPTSASAVCAWQAEAERRLMPPSKKRYRRRPNWFWHSAPSSCRTSNAAWPRPPMRCGPIFFNPMLSSAGPHP